MSAVIAISQATAWPEVPLGEVASFVRGITFKPEDVASLEDEGAVACLRTKNVQTKLDTSDVWGIPRRLVRRKEQFVRFGDVLVSSANSWNLIGKCSWIPELPWDTTFGGFVTILRADNSKLDQRYLYRWFSSPRVQAIVRSFGRQTTNIANLDIARCLAMPMPLPPLAEQQRLSDLFDKVENLRDKNRTALNELDALFESLRSRAFSGEL